ncbi:type II toxin-antitoxin system PemK/MazF family toxin [Cellulomonas sp. T2.31MG-18]|uniref:type II toxin-antitoxin system PemK/MazF family toxin n=1 Tax=Cellulomonas sp. T2.31MG-18 TaxID=3157619 RepID=UPI00366ADEF9
MAGSWWRTLLDRWRPSGSPVPTSAPRTAAGAASAASVARHRALRDFQGTVRPVYSPDLDGAPDPGEIVWTWVPFEEDPSQGKDRPTLLVSRDGPWLLGLMLTSKDHVPAGEAGGVRADRHGQVWLDLGTGPWDPRRRPSEVRLDRVLRIDPAAVRREGAVLPRATFDLVTRAMADRPA